MLKRFQIYHDTLAELFKLSLPMVISQGAFAIMIFTDRYFMSQIDPMHMAAALGGGVASFFSISLFIGVFSYANALVAQYLGAGEITKCPRVLTQGWIMTLMSMPVLLVVTYFVGHLFSAMGHNPEMVELEKIYYYLLMSCSFFTLCKVCIASYFAGIGRTKVVMIADLFGMIINVPLSYVLIFGKLGLPALGIQGAAIGTIISSFFALVLFLLFYFQREHREKFQVLSSFKIDKGIISRYIRLGFPSGFELFLNIAAFNLFLLMFQSYGIPQGASAAIVLNWDILSFVPMLGLNIGLISMIGRFVGANDMARTDQVIASGFLLGLGYTACTAILFILFRESLVEVFIIPGIEAQEIRELATFMMIGLASYTMADAIIIISGGVLRGAGDTRWLMLTSVSLHWSMLLAQYFIIRVFHYDPKISWLTFVIMIFLIAVVYYYRLKGGRWRDPEVLKRVMEEK